MAVFYKEEAERQRYPQAKYPLILQNLCLEGSCISKFLMKKSPNNQEASNVTGWWQQTFGTMHCGSKKLRQVQNFTRKIQGRKVHWGPFDIKTTTMAQKSAEHCFWRLGKYHREVLLHDSFVPVHFPTCLVLATVRDRIQGKMDYWSLSDTAFPISALKQNLA